MGAGGDLLAGGEAVVEPAQRGGRRDVESWRAETVASSTSSSAGGLLRGWWQGMCQWVRSEAILLAVYDIARVVVSADQQHCVVEVVGDVGESGEATRWPRFPVAEACYRAAPVRR
jgi:hypothetical protein